MRNANEQLTEILKSDDISFQTLPNCITRAEFKKSSGYTEITFATKSVDISEATEARNVVGIVVWVPRDAFDRATKD